VSVPAPPQARDQDSTGFTKHLDSLVRQVPEALCAVFVDAEGEAVDLATRIDPFDARITAAESAIVLHALRASREKLGEGALLEFRIEGVDRSLIIRIVSKGYDLVLLVSGSAISGRAAEMTAATALALLVEAGLSAPPSYAVLRSVEQRPSRIGFVVPTAFEEQGVRRRVEAILGHRDDGDGHVKFLVRLDDGEELVVTHDRVLNRWQRA
jgi:predicted regulator of Ras-like GTPase activity (Roadblock/LC7/MglB family)